MSDPERIHPLNDQRLAALRLEQFLGWMLPIAVGFAALYFASAYWLESKALIGGGVAVLGYVVALGRARGLIRSSRHADAAGLTSTALFLMVWAGAVLLPFLYPALLLMPIAGVALALPHLTRGSLRRLMFGAFVTDLWVLLWGVGLPALLPQPPETFRIVVIAAAVAASVGLTLRMLWVDHLRLRQSLARAEEAVQARDLFLGIASHELNTPLTPLVLSVEGLQRMSKGGSPEAVVARLPKDLSVMERQLRRLSELVRDLLDVSRIGAGRLEVRVEEVDLSVLVPEVLARFQPLAERAQSPLHFHAHGPVAASCDPLRMEQVVSNLVSNALKYGARRPVQVSVEGDGQRVRLRVEDQGIGIPAPELPRVFDKFVRAAPEKHYGGLGLGLYITRELVEAMGGNIRAENLPDRGSAFTVELQAAKGAAAGNGGDGANDGRAVAAGSTR